MTQLNEVFQHISLVFTDVSKSMHSGVEISVKMPPKVLPCLHEVTLWPWLWFFDLKI